MASRLIVRVALMMAGLAAFPLAAPAQDFSDHAMKNAFPYKDLPGVKPSDRDREEGRSTNCTQELRQRHLGRMRDFGPATGGIVYRCEDNGVIIESERPPLRKYWNPLDER